MDEPLTWRAIRAICELLGAIDGSDGWYTDLGLHPLLADRSQNPDANATFTYVVAGDITTSEESTGRSRRSISGDMEVVVEFAIPFDSESAELLAHQARADIVRALASDLRDKPGGLRALTIEQTNIRDAVLTGTKLVIAQVVARASLTESISVPA